MARNGSSIPRGPSRRGRRTGARTLRSRAERVPPRTGAGPPSAMMRPAFLDGPSGRFQSVMRRFAVAAFMLALAAPAGAASKEIERLQIQIAGLQTQLADLQRSAEDTQREVRRLNEQLADQGASFRKTLADQRVQEEAIAAALKDLSDRLAEIHEGYQALKAALPPASGAPSASVEPGAGGGTTAGSLPPGGAPGAPTPAAPPPAPRELYTQAYADFARGNYDLAIAGFSEYIKA